MQSYRFLPIRCILHSRIAWACPHALQLGFMFQGFVQDSRTKEDHITVRCKRVCTLELRSIVWRFTLHLSASESVLPSACVLHCRVHTETHPVS
jgi:hypothetical protein